MSIASEITRIHTNVSNAFQAIRLKGGSAPDDAISDQLEEAILSLPVERAGFQVIAQMEEPEETTENTVWIQTDLSVPFWTVCPRNPFQSKARYDLRFSTLSQGYISTSGVLQDPNSTNQEYTLGWFTGSINMPSVVYGQTYTYEYSLPNSVAPKSMWLAVSEYNSSEEFIKRTVLVSSVNGGYATGTYTPSSENVKYVKLSWRSFGASTSEYRPVLYRTVTTNDTSIPDGTVWIRTDEYGTAEIDVLDENNTVVHIAGAEIFSDYGWNPVQIFIYQSGKWALAQLIKPLLTAPDQHESITGGWTCPSGTLELFEDSIRVIGGTGRLSTLYPISTYGYRTLEFDIMCTSTSAATVVGIGINQTSRVYYETLPLAMSDFETMSIDLTDHQGIYYVNLQTAASSVGCYIKAARLIW